MNPRSITVLILSLAALAGSVISGLTFTILPSSGEPTAWLFNITACFLVILLGYTIQGGTHSTSILLATLALCLPAAGPALATLIALTIHSMRPADDGESPFCTGNPVTSEGFASGPHATLGRPLVSAVRRLEPINQFRLLCGIPSLPPSDSRHVLIRLRDSEDAQIRLFAQGGLSDAVEACERHLKVLTRRARSHPGEVATHCAIAEINLHLLEQHLVEEDARPAAWEAANHAVAEALRSDPEDALSLRVCARIKLIGGATAEARAAARKLAGIPGHEATARLLLAEASFADGDFESVRGELEGVMPGAADRDEILDFWRKPRPIAYA